MPLQILALKLDGIAAGDYLTWCRDPEPPVLDFALRSISIDADLLGDTITASLDWNQPPPRSAVAAAAAAGLPLPAGVEIHALLTDRSHALPACTATRPNLTYIPATVATAATVGGGQSLPVPG
jgi:hypothetical protein